MQTGGDLSLQSFEFAAQHGPLAQWLIILLIGTLIAGIVLGWTQRIVVFRNYNDLGLAFLVFIAPLGVGILTISIGATVGGPIVWFMLLLWTALLLFIVDRAWRDNGNVLGTLLAVYTKVLLGVLFVFAFLDFVAPAGSKRGQRAAVRRRGLMLLLVLTPVVYALVRDKEGYFSPPSVPGVRPSP